MTYAGRYGAGMVAVDRSGGVLILYVRRIRTRKLPPAPKPTGEEMLLLPAGMGIASQRACEFATEASALLPWHASHDSPSFGEIMSEAWAADGCVVWQE